MNLLICCDGPVPHQRMNYRGEPLVAYLGMHPDYDVHVVCPRPEVAATGFPGIHFHFTRPFRRVRNLGSAIDRALDSVRLMLVVRRILRSTQIDCIRTISTLPTVAARLARGRSTVPIVANLSDFYSDLYASSRLPFPQFFRGVIDRMNRFASRVQAVIVDSEEQRRAWIAVGARPATCFPLPHGIPRSLRLPTPGLPPPAPLRQLASVPAKSKILFYVGDISDLDGIDVLLESVAALRRAGTPVVAVIVGAGSSKSELALRDLTLHLGLTDHVRRIESVHNEHLPALMSESDVLVAPFRMSATSSTAIPNKVLEFLTTDVAIVVTRTTPLERLLGRSVEFIPPEDVAALTKALSRCIDDPANAGGDLKARAVVRARLDWHRIIDDEVRLIRAIVAGTPFVMPPNLGVEESE